MSKMNFEQVPVATVKKIAEEFTEFDSANNDTNVDRTNRAIATPGNWRDAAQRVLQEEDPNRVVELVQHLIAKFDEERPLKPRTPRS